MAEAAVLWLTGAMDESNPYAPPAAELEAPADPAVRPLPFYAVSILKLVLLSLATFGYYVVYWHYRQWKAIRDAEGRKLWPIPRAFFAALTGFELYPHIHAAAEREGLEIAWQGWMPALAAFVINLVLWFTNFAPSSIPAFGFVWILAILPPWLAQSTIQALHA